MANFIKFKKGNEERNLYYDTLAKDLNVSGSAVEKELLIDRMLHENIRTCIVVYSEQGHGKLCRGMAGIYRNHGIEMISLFIQFYGSENYKLIRNAAKNLSLRLNDHSCIVLSFDSNRLLSLFILLLLIYLRRSPLQAVDMVRRFSRIGKYAGIENRFIKGFHQYMLAKSVSGKEKPYAPKPWEKTAQSGRPQKIQTRHKKIAQNMEYALSGGKVRDEADGPQDSLKVRHFSLSTVLHWLGSFRQSIQFKLMMIVSGTLICSMLIMILLATHFFKSDNETRVQENNLNISTIVADKIKTDILAIIGKAKSIALAFFNDNDSDNERAISPEMLINEEEDFIYVGMAGRIDSKPSVRPSRGIINRKYAEVKGIRTRDIESLSLSRETFFSRSYNSEIMAANLSREIKSPLIGISFPFEVIDGKVQSILLVYINPNRFIKNFSRSGITETFMVNLDGDVLAHTDTNLVLMNVNFLSSPIVRNMLKSAVDNGQTRYKGEDSKIYLGSFKKVGISGLGIISRVPEEKAFEAVYNIQTRNIYILLIVINISILAVFFFSKTMTKPIIELAGETEKIKIGNYNIQLKPRTRDEIGILTDSFIEMSKGLQERERIKNAFGKFVNREIAEMAMHQELQLGGIRKEAVIVFCDIRSFTAISETLDPENVVEFLNNYLTRMVQCINDNFGVVDKFIGDAIMAVWGAPVSSGNDIQNAVNSVLQMRYQLELFNMDRGVPGKPPIKMGCGINAGPVIAGQIGSSDRMEYTVIGDTVNLASRVEALNKAFGTDILITEATYRKIRGAVKAVRMPPVTVKGKKEPFYVYAVLGNADDTDTPVDLADLRKLLKTSPDLHVDKGVMLDECKYEVVE